MLKADGLVNADNVSINIEPVVINEKLKEELFGNENAIGKVLGQDSSKPKHYRSVQGNWCGRMI